MSDNNPRLRRIAAAILGVLTAAVVAVVAPWSASPASAAVGYACWRDGDGVNWPQYPAGSIYVTRVFPAGTWPACGNTADPNGIGAVSYIPPGDLFEGVAVCWRWTNRLAGSDGLPSPWAYRDGFLISPQCRETSPISDSGRDTGREVWCPSCPHDNDRLDLRLFFNGERGDNLTDTAESGGDGYSFIGTVGRVFKSQSRRPGPPQLLNEPIGADHLAGLQQQHGQ